MNELRWSTYFLAARQAFEPFWRDFVTARERRVLLIAGLGFDARSAKVTGQLVSANVPIADCWLLRPAPTSHDQSELAEFASRNEATFRGLLAPLSTNIDVRTIEGWSSGRWVGGINASTVAQEPDIFATYTDVIVDVTALPRGMYFPLVATLLELWCVASMDVLANVNLHLAVYDDPEFDALTSSEGGDAPDFVHGFRWGFENTAIADVTTIWIPLIGEDKRAALDSIHRSVRPAEIIPVFPFPSRNAHRGDALMLAYRDLLIDTWPVDPRNVSYAAEDNPFDVYLQIGGIVRRYKDSLKALGPTRIALSSHASKLMSLGALLAAWELRLAVSHVQPTSYAGNPDASPSGECYEMFLVGECYEPE